MILLEMLYFLVLIMLHHHISIKENNNFSVLVKGPTEGITDNVDAAEKKVVWTLVWKRQNFVWACITTVLIVIYM